MGLSWPARITNTGMSVADNSAGGSIPKPLYPGGRKRGTKPITEHDWKAIRLRYEGSDISQRRLAQELGVSYSTLSHRAMRERWSQSAALVHQAREQVAIKTSEALQSAASHAADLAAKQLIDELQPWIAEQKTQQIKRAIARSTKAQQRLDAIADGTLALDKDGNTLTLPNGPKEESFIAQAEDKYDNIIRRNLGMQDGSGFSGALSVNILAGQAAVSVSQS